MKTKLLVGLIACAIGVTDTVMAESGAVVRYHVVTAPTSPTNNSSIQNVMSYVDKGGVVGLIPHDINTDPAAINMPPLLRVSEIIYGPVGLKLWDAVQATGMYADQNGQRFAWSFDYTNRTAFLASDIFFRVWSSDAANTLRFSGNLATNGISTLTFSPTLRGELWDENGNKVATYYNGETVSDHPINRVMALIRLGYYVTDMTQVQLDLDYFRDQMTLTNFVAFYNTAGWGVTNWISSLCYLTANPLGGVGDKYVTLEGQRRIGLTYGLIRTPSLNTNEVVWSVVASRMVDGASYYNDLPTAYFRAYEEGINLPLPDSARKEVYAPVLRVWNGPE